MLLQSEADIARISKMLDTNFMFQNLTTLQKEKVRHTDGLYIVYTYYIYSSHVLLCVEQVIRVMTQRRVAVDEMVIKEGDRGDEMYIVDRYTPSLLLLCAV